MRRVLGAVKGWAVGEVDYEKEKVVTSWSKVGKIAPPATRHLSGKEGRLRAKGAEDPEKIILKCDTFQKKINYGSLKSECLVVCMPHNGRVGSCLSSRVLYTFISMINSKASAPWHNL